MDVLCFGCNINSHRAIQENFDKEADHHLYKWAIVTTRTNKDLYM